MATKHDHDLKAMEAIQEPASAPAAASRDLVTGAPPTKVPPAEVTDEQALIEEARHRQRRRHRWISAIVVLALVGTGLGLGLSFGAGAPATKPHHRTTPSTAAPSSSSAAVALNRPEALAIASNGDVLIANDGTNQILRRTPSGTLTVVVGTGKAGYTGNRGPARRAKLDDPSGMAVAANGTIYIADTGNNRIRAISPKGIITTVAGNGRVGARGVGGPAVRAEVPGPKAVALGSKGQLYIADTNGVQVVSRKGVLTTVVATPRISLNGKTIAFTPNAIAVSRLGDLYVSDSTLKLLIAFTPTGHAVHSWQIYVTPAGMATARDGSVVVGNYGALSVNQIVDGQLSTLVTFTRNSIPDLTGTFRPSGIAVNRTGLIYSVTDGVNGGTTRPALVAINSSGHVQLLPTGPSH